jgi:hypothetical protein
VYCIGHYSCENKVYAEYAYRPMITVANVNAMFIVLFMLPLSLRLELIVRLYVLQ